MTEHPTQSPEVFLSPEYDPHEAPLLMVAPVHELTSLKDVPHDIAEEIMSERRQKAREGAKQTLKDLHMRETIDHLRIDPVTGVPNREVFEQEYPRLFMRGTPGEFTVMFADVRGLNQMNKHGHSAGDNYLRAAVAAMRSSLRPTDLIFRNGGDEFAIVAAVSRDEKNPHEPSFEDRLRSTVNRAEHYKHLPRIDDPGVYIGVAVKQPDDYAASKVLARADAACVAEKNAYHKAHDVVPRK